MHFTVMVIGEHTEEDLSQLVHQKRADYFEMTRGSFILRNGCEPVRPNDVGALGRAKIQEEIDQHQVEYDAEPPSPHKAGLMRMIEQAKYVIAEYDQVRAGDVDWEAINTRHLAYEQGKYDWVREIADHHGHGFPTALAEVYGFTEDTTLEEFLQAQEGTWSTPQYFFAATGQWHVRPPGGREFKMVMWDMMLSRPPQELLTIYHCHV